MFVTAAVSARAALLPWAAPLLPTWAPACAGPPDPSSASLEQRVPPMERAASPHHERVVALVEGPGLSACDELCVEELLRYLQPLWTHAGHVAPRSVRFRRLAIDGPHQLAPGLSQADLCWVQIAAESPFAGTPVGRWTPPELPERGVLALLRRGRLLLNPDPAYPLQAQDDVILRGMR
ncbi:MAG TPA: hypothetical protein V6D05_12705 [Stenomitos sp.]